MIVLKKGDQLNSAMRHTISDPLVQFYHNQVASRPKYASMPICPKCERIGFRDKGWMEAHIMTCPHCGYNGPATHMLEGYLKEGLYK